MKKHLIGAGLIWMLLGGTAVFAAEQTVKLDIQGMSCPSCPYQVESALKGVDGVISAKASLLKGSAVVKYDDAKTDIAALKKATEDVGFPSSLAKQGS
jgi:periplasmic mercuric ion binding protein